MQLTQFNDRINLSDLELTDEEELAIEKKL